MSGTRYIEGLPYSATFIENEDGFENSSFAAAIIQPPILFDTGGVAVNCTFNSAPRLDIRVEHVVSTQSKTLLEIEAEDKPDFKMTHEERLQFAFEGLAQYVGFLNRLENGTFDGETYYV